ncbi:unnamed protein product [Nyctereutes procyonoides]|uniref:(raccoon dog) hypothetical protein n=1 Tax=Nyctereutes procyonoides TaxID=34880 RepID=A0A811ZHY2_NYCPR|nr:unnamed protein product [Nyctereutes procyonoides]
MGDTCGPHPSMKKIKLSFGPAAELSARDRLTRPSVLPELSLAGSTRSRSRSPRQHAVRGRLPGDPGPSRGQAAHPLPPSPPRRPAEAPGRMRTCYCAVRSDASSRPSPCSLPRPLSCWSPELRSVSDLALPTPRPQSWEQCRPTPRALVVAAQKTDEPALTVDGFPSLSKRWDRTWDLPDTRFWAK